MPTRFLSCREAARLGIERLRLPKWANPMDHLKIDIVNGELGPWFHCWCPINEGLNSRDPVDFLWVLDGGDPDAAEYVPYDGPLPQSPEYRTAVDSFRVSNHD